MGRKKKQFLWSLNGREASDDHETQIPAKIARQHPTSREGFVSDAGLQYNGRNPERKLSQEEESLLAEVLAAFDDGVLDRLSEREHECFVAVMISGDGYDQVAKRVGVTRRVVEGYVNRAGAKIRQFIEEQYGV